MLIPFAPPYIDEDIISEVTDTLKSGWITSGPRVKELETKIEEYTGAPRVLCVNSATSALSFVMKWFGIGEGDEVIVPSYTYCSTAVTVLNLGATPVMVDIGQDFNMDISKLKNAITGKTKVIIPVDIAGLPCNYEELYDLLNEDPMGKMFQSKNENQKDLGRILILADAAHSFGASYKGRKSGSLADISVFSFHAVKNLTTAEGGAICFNLPTPFDNEKLYQKLKPLTLNGQTKDAFTKTQGNSWRYDVVEPGVKINMPDICAAIGLAQMRKYNFFLKRRKEIFDFYNKELSKLDWAQIPVSEDTERESSRHVYLLRIKDITEKQRDEIIIKMYEKGVSVNVHFVPLPMLTLFKNLGYDINDYPISLDNYLREITLPVYPQLTNEQLELVIASLVDSYNSVT